MIHRILCGIAVLCCSATATGAKPANEPLYAISSVDKQRSIHVVATAPNPKYNCPDQKGIKLALLSPRAIDLAQGESFNFTQLTILARGKQGESVIPEPLAITLETNSTPLIATRPVYGSAELLALRPGTTRLHVRALCPGRTAEVVIAINIKPVAGPYKAAFIGDEGHTLTIVTADAELQAPFTEKDQEGFGDPKVSPDHSVVGWLAQIGNCCTSYPLPLTLVLFKDGKVIQQLEQFSIWDWTFAKDGSAVAYRQRLPHGVSPVTYTLRSVTDGKTLEDFRCDPKDGQVEEFEMSGPVPDWVWPIAEECPER